MLVSLFFRVPRAGAYLLLFLISGTLSVAMVFKKCFVPSCKNTSNNSDKVFLSIPSDPKRRQRWLHVMKRNYSRSSSIYCCEDHFNLKEDSLNFHTFISYGMRLDLKKEVVPHRYIDHPAEGNIQQISESSKRRKRKLLGLPAPNISSKSSTTSNLLILDNDEFFIDVGELGITEEEATSLVKTWIQQLMQLPPARQSRAISVIANILSEEKSSISSIISTDAPESLPSTPLLYGFSQASECKSKLVTKVPASVRSVLRTNSQALEKHKEFVSATTFGALDALCDDSSEDAYPLDNLQQKLELQPIDPIEQESNNKSFSNGLLKKTLNTSRRKQNFHSDSVGNIELKIEVEPTVIIEPPSSKTKERVINNFISQELLGSSILKSNTGISESETSSTRKTKRFRGMSPEPECSNGFVSDWAIKVEPPDDLNDHLAADSQENIDLMVKVEPTDNTGSDSSH